METDFVTWLMKELETRDWSYSELARRADIAPSSISMVISRKRIPGWDVCAGIARAFNLPPARVFAIAGLLPSPYDAMQLSNEESETVSLLRRLSDQVRQGFMAILRSLVESARTGDTQAVGEPRAEYDIPRTFTERLAYQLARDLETLPPEDQQLVWDLMKRLRGNRRGNGEPESVPLEPDR